MSGIIKIAKTIRRNWKKSVVGFAAVSYGISYGFERYRTLQLMRAYCEEAKKYGEQILPQMGKPAHVTVILNPVAHDKKAKSLYEKYAAPLLHLAGLKVSVIQTESVGQARELMEIMSNTDAVIIAGGNGTLQEAVTGLLGREEYADNPTLDIPIGVVPVGNANSVAKVLFNKKSGNTAEWLAEAAMAVVRQSTVLLDVIKIEGPKEKPVYALSAFEMGEFPNLELNLSKYWYFGPLKAKVIYFYNSLKTRLLVDDLDFEFMPPCDGCSRCYLERSRTRGQQPERWWSIFLPRPALLTGGALPEKDYKKVVNEECGTWYNQRPDFSNLMITTSLCNFGEVSNSDKSLWVSIHPSNLTMKHFIQSGLAYHEQKPVSELHPNSVAVKEVKLVSREETERTCYIDTEIYEVQNVHLSLLAKHLLVYA